MKFLAREFKIVRIREMECPLALQLCDEPDTAVEYWRHVITTGKEFSDERENCYLIHLDTRGKITGHYLAAIGNLNSIALDARAIFRSAIIANAHSILILHNHPSGDATPSRQDVTVTRSLLRASRTIGIPIADHIIIGHQTRRNPTGYQSLRALGFFWRASGNRK